MEGWKGEGGSGQPSSEHSIRTREGATAAAEAATEAATLFVKTSESE